MYPYTTYFYGTSEIGSCYYDENSDKNCDDGLLSCTLFGIGG